MSYTLVIVESPAKSKTIERYLSKGYKVMASMGHVIDLPKSKLGIDVENGFAPTYEVIRGKGKVLSEIKRMAKGAEEVILATDPDREGEAISYHIANYLKMDLTQQNRIEFHEITQSAIENAMAHKRTVDMDLVNAQQARRLLDRLVGYKVSPVLWKKVMKGLSAGRVQSVATRIIVDREKEIRAFVAREYWVVSAQFQKDGITFEGVVQKKDGAALEILTQKQAQEVVDALKQGDFVVSRVTKSQKRRNPAAPFTTSSLQQEAYKRLGFSSKKTMMLAQQLYEGIDIPGRGHRALVTYIRTDSTRISAEARDAAQTYILRHFTKDYLNNTVIGTKGKAKVQDAHEAIRPVDVFLTPDSIRDAVQKDVFRLYDLIFTRFLAANMTPAVFDTVSVDIANGAYLLRASGSRLHFDGFLKVYESSTDDDKNVLPALEEKELLQAKKIIPSQKFTQPPARYTEASLIKALEEHGIGRPSTYAPTISTILTRGYVVLKEKKFFPTDVGEAVTFLLQANFPNIVSIKFTADMEESLDKIAAGELSYQQVLASFNAELEQELSKADSIERIKLPEVETDEVCEKCGAKMVIKTGRFGKFLACPNFPSCSNTRPLIEKIEAKCPKCQSEIVVRKTKKGRTFYGCKAYPQCDFVSWDKPLSERCPQCGEMLYEKTTGKKKVYCKKEGCAYVREN